MGVEEGDAIGVGERGVAAFEVFWARGGVVLRLGDGGLGSGRGAGGKEVKYCERGQSVAGNRAAGVGRGAYWGGLSRGPTL